jgi:alanyl-tRNA synthetase
MTERLYYHDSFLYDFDARVVESLDHNGRAAIVLDRTAFYPTSGGQVHDLGMIAADGKQIAVTEVADEEDGRILHFAAEPIPVGTQIHGTVDAARRRDHIQAAFRTASDFSRIHSALQYAHGQLSHGRRELHH